MCIAWSGSVLQRTSGNLGPLAVLAPLLEQMDVAAIIDRHLPPDPQLEFSHGQVLRMLLGARWRNLWRWSMWPAGRRRAAPSICGASPPTSSTMIG